MSLVATVRTRLAVLATITLVVSASLSLFAAPVLATDVGTDGALRTAWADPVESLISLTADITLNCEGIDAETLDAPTRNSETDIVVDGNGHTLHNPCSFAGLVQSGVGKVTLQDLTFTGNDSSGHGLSTNGAVAVSDSSVTGHGEAGINADGDVGADGSTISGNVEGDGIRSGGDVTVGDSEITANGVDEFNCGGGIDADGDVTVDDSTVSGNGDVGILADGDITVSDSVVAGNGLDGECDEDGIQTESGTASVTRSTVSGNGADTGGSGIVASEVNATASTITGNGWNGILAGAANVTNSTITAHNGEGGAGIRASVEVNATHATISGNEVNINNSQGQSTHLFGTVLLDAGVANCFGAVTDDGHNFVDDDSCGSIPENSADPMLGALADNGGPTWTRLPAAGSPLLNAIPSGDCEIASEQRGLFARPQGAGCDIGSVEVQAAPVATPSPSPTPIPSATPIPSGSAIPTLPPTSAAAVEESAPATGSIVLVVGLLAAVLLVSLARPRIPGRP